MFELKTKSHGYFAVEKNNSCKKFVLQAVFPFFAQIFKFSGRRNILLKFYSGNFQKISVNIDYLVLKLTQLPHCFYLWMPLYVAR